MLRAITVAGVAASLVFIAWSYFVMAGGQEWITSAMATEEKDKAPAKVAAKAEPPKQEPAKPADPKPEAKPSTPAPAETKPEETAAAEPAKPEAAKPAEPVKLAEADTGAATETDASAAPAGDVDPAGNPLETAKAAAPGTLVNPYQDDIEAVAKDGRKIYMAAGCNGCHGGTGGGGMGPPLTNPVWVYGNDGDTLFRLIALGTKGIEEQDYTRQRSELVKGPMPPFGTIIKSNDDMWKMIAWIWSVNTYTKPGDKPYPVSGGS